MHLAPLLAALAICAAPGASENAPKDAESAVKLADNAFKFRDFASVVTILEPWLHPPQILDRELLIAARKLLGVSLHVLGREAEAREEFGQLLLLDPTHELDPFVFPPNVIVAFEAVRTQMKATLDRITGRKDPPKEDPDAKVVKLVELVEVPSKATMFLPGGLPQFLLSEPGWGTMWLAIQVAAIVLNIGANRRGATPEISRSEFRTMLALQYIGAGTLLGAWVGSAIQGLDQHESYKAALQPPQPASPELTQAVLNFTF